MTDWIDMPAALLAEAARMLDPWQGRAGDTGDESVPRELVAAMVTYLDEDNKCDHSVNICYCYSNEIAYQLKLLLDDKKVCPNCNGEGAVYVDTRVVHPGYAEQDIWERCTVCASSGVVPIAAHG